MIPLPPTLGPYVLGETVGSGGMGTVVAATHRYLGRRVALKIRARDGRGEEERLTAERFRLGARLQSQLQHDHIVRIHEYFETAELQIAVMEMVGGGSVEQRLAHGPLPIAAAVAIAERAASGLAYAHGLGIIHRDIKPGNLLLGRVDDPSSVRLSDFGVAKSVSSTSEELTMAGANVGTLWYMPPEQFNAEAPTPQVDVYALGATLYEMLTAQVPLEEASHAGLFRRFLDRRPPPPVRGHNPGVPLLLAAVVEQALALEPAERVPSAAVFATWIRAAIVATPVERAIHLAGVERLEASVSEARGAIGRLPGPVRLAVDAALDRLLEREGVLLAAASQPAIRVGPRRGHPTEPPPTLAPAVPEDVPDASFDNRSVTAVSHVRLPPDDEDERTVIMELGEPDE
ncbi:serine/threonine protein kinase [Myxococcota bacterium]|nr:serine/threonine protein kinase [Myxococcota bacterium]